MRDILRLCLIVLVIAAAIPFVLLWLAQNALRYEDDDADQSAD